jgi:hypothetical protein
MKSCLTSTDGTKYRAGYYESWLIWRNNNKIKSSNLQSEKSSLIYTGHNNDLSITDNTPYYN